MSDIDVFDIVAFDKIDAFAIHQFGAPQPNETYPWATSIVRDRASELTVMTAIRRGLIPGEYRTWEERLRTMFASINDRADRGIPTTLNAVTPIHFARWFILRPEQYRHYSGPPTRDGAPPYAYQAPYDPDYPEVPAQTTKPPQDTEGWHSWLVLTVTFSGDLAPYLRFLSERVTSELDRVWGHCEGYPGARDFESFWLWVRRHQIQTNAFYASYTQLSPPATHRLRAFKDHFDAFVARTRGPNGESVSDIGRLFDEFIHQNLAYTKDFPGEGGLYNDGQEDRFAELRKCQRTP